MRIRVPLVTSLTPYLGRAVNTVYLDRAHTMGLYGWYTPKGDAGDIHAFLLFTGSTHFAAQAFKVRVVHQ